MKKRVLYIPRDQRRFRWLIILGYASIAIFVLFLSMLAMVGFNHVNNTLMTACIYRPSQQVHPISLRAEQGAYPASLQPEEINILIKALSKRELQKGGFL